MPDTTMLDRHPIAGAAARGLRVTAAMAIFERLHAAITALELVPGTPLQEKLLAEQFGVSRTPVREALIRLAEAGLVDIYPQSGTFVSRIPLAALPEATIVRQALEGATVEMAARRADPCTVARLDDLIARQALLAARNDVRAFHEVDEAFHEAIAEGSGHPGIWKVVRASKVQIDRARRLTLPVPGRMQHVIDEHRTIRNAIAAGDAEAARRAMRRHLEAVIVDVRPLVESRPDYFA